METYDVAIVGGGCVGLSIAKHLAEATELDICVFEKNHQLAAHQSGRNSGILHPGIGYAPGSYRAEFHRTGVRRMLSYCRENDVPIAKRGMVMVAADEEEQTQLRKIAKTAEDNGIATTLLTGRDRINEYEPEAAGREAIHCSKVATVDSQAFVYCLGRDSVQMGVHLFRGQEVKKLEQVDDGYHVQTDKGLTPARYVINAAGLHADRLAHSMSLGGEYRILPIKARYYELRPERRELVQSVLYPTPDPDHQFYHVHFMRLPNGRVLVGPTGSLAYGREAYSPWEFDIRELVDLVADKRFRKFIASRETAQAAWHQLEKSYRKSRFVEDAQRIVPAVRSDDLVRTFCGISAQLVDRKGSLVQGPIIEHGERCTHILDPISLTASLPFGESMASEVRERII